MGILNRYKAYRKSQQNFTGFGERFNKRHPETSDTMRNALEMDLPDNEPEKDDYLNATASAESSARVVRVRDCADKKNDAHRFGIMEKILGSKYDAGHYDGVGFKPSRAEIASRLHEDRARRDRFERPRDSAPSK